jgi:hypothetical protein
MSKQFWKKILGAIGLRRPSLPVRLVVDSTGVSILQENKPTERILWREIIQIQAYKKDLITEDLVCWDFTVDANQSGPTYTLHEEMVGFEELDAKLGKVIPAFDRKWREKVILPPFAQSRTTIYQRVSRPPFR